MWQRFTERARRAIMIAQEEAQQLHSSEVTTSHLLLALLGETESPAAQFLQTTGINPDAVRAAIERPASAAAHPNGIPLSQEMKNLLTDAAQVARELQHHDIDSHHLLLALLGAPRGNAARLLEALHHNPQQLRAQLEEQLKEGVLPIASQPDAVTAKGNIESAWTRFTQRARHVILLAQDEADRMQHSEVGTPHLFSALLREGEGTAAQVLIQMGLNLEAVRQAGQVLKAPGQTLGPPPKLSSQAKRMLELSAEEARELRHNYIGTEHLLLALLHPECGLSPLLKQLKLESGEMRRQMLEYLS